LLSIVTQLPLIAGCVDVPACRYVRARLLSIVAQLPLTAGCADIPACRYVRARLLFIVTQLPLLAGCVDVPACRYVRARLLFIIAQLPLTAGCADIPACRCLRPRLLFIVTQLPLTAGCFNTHLPVLRARMPWPSLIDRSLARTPTTPAHAWHQTESTQRRSQRRREPYPAILGQKEPRARSTKVQPCALHLARSGRVFKGTLPIIFPAH
jgi:hypothetical protein